MRGKKQSWLERIALGTALIGATILGSCKRTSTPETTDSRENFRITDVIEIPVGDNVAGARIAVTQENGQYKIFVHSYHIDPKRTMEIIINGGTPQVTMRDIGEYSIGLAEPNVAILVKPGEKLYITEGTSPEQIDQARPLKITGALVGFDGKNIYVQNEKNETTQVQLNNGSQKQVTTYQTRHAERRQLEEELTKEGIEGKGPLNFDGYMIVRNPDGSYSGIAAYLGRKSTGEPSSLLRLIGWHIDKGSIDVMRIVRFQGDKENE